LGDGAFNEKLNQGVNIQTGPNGEVYVAWANYDLAGMRGGGLPDESSLGFAVSTDGGVSYSSSIIRNIEGIRHTGVNKCMRLNSYPSMAVDNSNGPARGRIYIVWANRGQVFNNNPDNPEVNILLAFSDDHGSNWTTLSQPIDVHDLYNGPSHAWFPWIMLLPFVRTKKLKSIVV